MTTQELQSIAQGKTHYFSPGILRFFGSRLSSIVRCADGSIKGIESARVAWQGARQYRAWRWDGLWTEVARTEWGTRYSARKAFASGEIGGAQ